MRIMVCFDESDASQAALELGSRYAHRMKAELVLVTSLESGTAEEQDRINAANQQLETARRRFEEEGLTCNTGLLIHGLSPGEDLTQFAGQRDIDLMIIGIVKKSKVGKLLFGSTAQYVILNAPCPVLTVKD
jgi:nucleotide-binding universal stress UspA family protein